METLHTHWQLDDNAQPYGGRLLFWLERPSDSKARKRHPHALSSDAILARLNPDGFSEGTLTSAQLRLQLPSKAAPLSLHDDPAGARLRSWNIPALSYAGTDGLLLLWDVLELQAAGDLQLALAPSVRYWHRALTLLLRLLARHDVLPQLHGRQARWQVQTLRERPAFEALLTAMPPVCRAETADPARPQQADELLESFLQTNGDALLREWLPRADSLPANAVGRFLAGLHGEPRRVGSTAQIGYLQERQEAWRRNLQGTGNGPLRVGLCLEVPDQPDGPWRLQYLLQARNDPSLQVPAALVWADDERLQSLASLSGGVTAAREELLAGLGYAARLSEPIRSSLNQAAPTHVQLSATQAFEFLRETTPLLEESGFAVLVPAWWSAQSARLGARVSISAEAGGVGDGLLSLANLISYRWELSLGGEALDEQAFQALVDLKSPLAYLRGQWVRLDPEQVEQAVTFYQQRKAAVGEGEAGLLQALQLRASQGGELDGFPLDAVSAEGALQGTLDRLEGNIALEPVSVPAALQATLRPYQKDGLAWLVFLEKLGLGACLADDMGLGKTVQALALLEHLREQGRLGEPVLLVCPTSVVSNWSAEAARFSPGLRVLEHQGSDRLGGEDFRAALQDSDLVLTSYALVRRDAELLQSVHWRGVILDEAQYIKNPHAKGSRALFALQAGFKLALTGTPVENRLAELWSIMRFLNPGHLGSLAAFRRSFARPIERDNDPTALARLRQLIEPFILRRSKRDPLVIDDLPDKIERQHECLLTAEQASLYQVVVQEGLKQIKDSAGIGRDGQVLSMLTRLKQICNHPAHYLQENELGGAERSGKLARMLELLEEAVGAGDSVLIFTQYRRMGELLNQHLQRQLGLDTLYLHGGTPAKKRSEMVARFQAGGAPPVFLLSLKAGGTGLNLTRANHVFHFDRWWNPAVEAQATDRAFRIGQTRNVLVHTLLSKGTLEERIDLLMRRKQELAERIVEGDTAWLSGLDSDALRDLVTLGAGGSE